VRIGFILVIGLAFVRTGGSQIQNSAPPEQLEQLALAESRWLASKPDAYPTRVCVDPTPVMDDEFGFVITDFRATLK
jgi:hypothetical protein